MLYRYGTVELMAWLSGFMNSFYQNEMFQNKKTAVIVPHMDDEINAAGSMIHNLAVMGCTIDVLYTTNGNSGSQGAVRLEEAKKALKLLAGKDVGVFALDVIDQSRGAGTHVSFGKRKCIKNQIKAFLREIMPDICICIDMDSHPDHICASLTFEHAMGELLKETENYAPLCYKGFAYKTAYFSYDDTRIGRGLCNTGADNLLYQTKYRGMKLDNPVYHWADRVRFPVLEECTYTGQKAADNIILRALSAHATQNAESHAGRIINSDICFFERRTDSLSYHADIWVSSGKKEYLNDFLLLDTDNVMSRKRRYKDYIWMPEDTDQEKIILMEFARPVKCNSVVFWQNPDRRSRLKHIRISFENCADIEWKSLGKDEIRCVIEFEEVTVRWIKLQVLDAVGSAGISELEVYGNHIHDKYDVIKIMQKDNFVYRCLGTKNRLFPFSVYGYKIRYGSDLLSWESVNVRDFKRDGEEYMHVSLKGYPSVYDEIPIVRYTAREYVLFCICRILHGIESMLKDGYHDICLVWFKARILIRRFFYH